MKLEKDDYIKLLNGTVPFYSKLTEDEKKLVIKGGLSQVDMLGEEWDWTYHKLSKMTNEELYTLYQACKDSWNRK